MSSLSKVMKYKDAKYFLLIFYNTAVQRIHDIAELLIARFGVLCVHAVQSRKVSNVVTTTAMYCLLLT